MTGFIQCEINGVPLRFCQCETNDEIKRNGLPAGQSFFWQLGNETITSPTRVIELIQIESRNFGLQITDPKTIAKFHTKILRRQKALAIRTLQNTKRDCIKRGQPREHVEQIQKTINAMREEQLIDMDGVARINLETLAELQGKDIKQMMEEDGLINPKRSFP